MGKIRPIEIDIKDLYTETYPEDTCGEDLMNSINFQELWESLKVRGDIYEFLGAHDSIIRERCFQKLSELINVSYDRIYDLWLHSELD